MINKNDNKLKYLEVGDKVMIVKEHSYHCFKIGDIVEVAEIDYKSLFHDDIPIRAWRGVYAQWVTPADIMLLEDEK